MAIDKWCVKIEREDQIPLAMSYLRENKHKYDGYHSSWDITLEGDHYFYSEGNGRHSSWQKEKGFKLITYDKFLRIYNKELIYELWN